jgi:hypothetical protein
MGPPGCDKPVLSDDAEEGLCIGRFIWLRFERFCGCGLGGMAFAVSPG